MAIVERSFGRPPSMTHAMTVGKEFADALMDIDVGQVLDNATYQRRIGREAARLAGVALQREGEAAPKNIISGAYDNIYDLLQPVLAIHSLEETRALFALPASRETLINLAGSFKSSRANRIAYRYHKDGNYLQLTDDGLLFTPETQAALKKDDTENQGCPYAKSEKATYFNRFTDHIVDTFLEAHERRMPHGWLDITGRFLLKR